MATEAEERMRQAMAEQQRKHQEALSNLREITKDPMRAQEELLKKIIADNADTEYGRKYDFASIKSIEDFQRRLPLTTYEDMKPYISRMADHGERNLITSYPLHFYNKTSGTAGEPKRVPMTDIGIATFQRYAADYQAGLIEDTLGAQATLGRALSLVQARDTETMNDGLEFGALSDYFMKQLVPFWDMQFTTPAEAAFAGPGTDIRYLQTRYGLTAADPVCFGCSYASFAAEFFRYIESNWELIVRDIELGTIDESVDIPDELKETLLAKTKPAPERAKELRAIFSRGFDEPFATKVWPRLAFFNGAVTGSFVPFGELIKNRYLGPDVRRYCRGVCASEGAFTAPVELDSTATTLLPDSVFYEFAEEIDGEADLAHLKTLDQIEEGKKYELIITNLNGYYRYRMRDVFLVCGRYQGTPLVEFQYRSDKTIDFLGVKTTEIALRATALNAANSCGARLVNSTVYLDTDQTRYVFLLEIENIPEALTEGDVRDAVEAALALANPTMGDMVRKGIYKPTEVKFVQPETFLLWRDLQVMRGASPGQQKPVTVIATEQQKRFFFAQTESFEELKEVFRAK